MTDPLAPYIRDVPDFPKPGILFRDITPLLASPEATSEAVRRMADPFRTAGITKVAAAEARGFLFGVSIALELGAGFIPVRKPGKLPYETREVSYDLEYGSDTLQIHADAIAPSDTVLLVDDLLATGGTMEACLRMVRDAGATVAGCSFLIELTELPGRSRLGEAPVATVLSY